MRVPTARTAGAPRIERAEFVLPGHPDKLCDAVADTLVAHMAAGDARAQCGVEVACVFDRVFVTGRIAGARELLDALDLSACVARAYREAGYGVDAAGHAWGPLPESLRVDAALCFGEFEPGERELRHCADDQAVCVGFASPDPDTDHLPPAHWLARRIGRELARLRTERGAGEVGPDGKVLVHVAVLGDRWWPDHVSISLNHHEGSDWLLLHRIAQEAVENACAGRPVPGLLLNGAGMFVAGGPNGDNGTTGKKLVVDAYGPTVPIGGGAWSGKDFNKVDRLGAMLARRLARRHARVSGEAARVEISYVPGCTWPHAIAVTSAAGHAVVDPRAPVDGWSTANAEVTARCLAGPGRALPELARWGHFGADAGPWERPC
jgi:S-adenosylmethionine synthetase